MTKRLIVFQKMAFSFFHQENWQVTLGLDIALVYNLDVLNFLSSQVSWRYAIALPFNLEHLEPDILLFLIPAI